MRTYSVGGIILLLLGILIAAPETVRAQALPEAMKRAIVRLETPEAKLGTGFILSDSVLGYFLVTNKHVIWSCSTGSYYDSVFVRKNAITQDGKVVATDQRSTLLLRRKGRQLFVEHPDQAVDLVLVQLGNIIDSDGSFMNPSSFEMIHGFKTTAVASRSDFKNLAVGDGTPVQVIGFSFKVRQSEQFHISRFGHISIAPSSSFPLAIQSPCDSLPVERKADWIVLDLSSRGGDSGGPMFAFGPRLNELWLIGLVAAGNQAEEFCFGVPSYRIHELVDKTRATSR